MKTTAGQAFLILGDQLYTKSLLPKEVLGLKTFMAEDFELCSHYTYHQHKLVLFLSAMRHYAEALKDDLDIDYHEFKPTPQKTPDFVSRLENFIKKNKIKTLHRYEIEDKFFDTKINSLTSKLGIEVIIHNNPGFICKRSVFSDYLKTHKKPFMKTFYEQQRREQKILVTGKGDPVGGKWSFDDENRLPYKEGLKPPKLPWVKPSKITSEIIDLVKSHFSKHPGDASTFQLPVTHNQAEKWLDLFLKERLSNFGPYEDSITPSEDVLYHSLLTPMLNTGLLTPKKVIDKAIKFAQDNKTPINSLEGFVRQVMGWREFIRGIYQNFSEKQDSANFFKHQRKLNSSWYDGTTGIPPLDDAIKKASRLGYCHHIERLMILSNMMLLCRVHPQEVHRWFMEMFVDSADWVMGPNVYGMGQFSDGGLFATKPYICGSNYWIKMSNYKKDPSWCDIVDGLYWSFIEDHKSFFESNPRLSMMPRMLQKIDSKRKAKIFKAAKEFIARVTT